MNNPTEKTPEEIVKEYIAALKIVISALCLCWMCRQLLAEEIKMLEKEKWI